MRALQPAEPGAGLVTRSDLPGCCQPVAHGGILVQVHSAAAGISATDVATLATAGFAAVAAGASWMTVLQTRRERVAAQTPVMSIDITTPLGSSEVRVTITNPRSGSPGSPIRCRRRRADVL